MITTHPTLDTILLHYQAQISSDFDGYRNHCYRVLNIYQALGQQHGVRINLEQAAVALAFHDVGIWTEHTIDYLPPSACEAQAYLAEHPALDMTQTLLMINEHHKIRPFKQDLMVELFRQADLVDFSLGLVRHGVDKSLIKQLKKTFPNAGFHKRLLRLGMLNLIKHPLKPAPMMKW